MAALESECAMQCAHRGPCALDEEQDVLKGSGILCTNYKLSNLGPGLLGWEGRIGRTVLSESFDL